MLEDVIQPTDTSTEANAPPITQVTHTKMAPQDVPEAFVEPFYASTGRLKLVRVKLGGLSASCVL